MKTAKWEYRVVSIQVWNNNKEQILSYHKSFNGAEKSLKWHEKQQNGNKYRIDKMENN